MTPEQFETKWGEALKAAGIKCEIAFVLGDRCVMLDGFFFHLGDKAEWAARGILVKLAAERNCAVVQADAMTSGHAWWQMQYITGTPVCDDEELYAEFDAALIAGWLALAEAERSKTQ